ncbi:MAG: hypothetical protein ACYDHP_12085 [Ferrimicrobium sp.]
MPTTTPFTIGVEVICSDGGCGYLTRVVIDPIARVVTHLVADPKHGVKLGRLVPVELVVAVREGIELSCTKEEFEDLEDAEETQFLPGSAEGFGYTDEQTLFLPYYGLGMGGIGVGTMGIGNEIQPIVRDRTPEGKFDVRRGDQVKATDGAIGRVQGLLSDARSHQVTHVLLQAGHLWGRKEVAIPISAVAEVTDGIHLNLTKDQVKGLPPVDLADPGATDR